MWRIGIPRNTRGPPPKPMRSMTGLRPRVPATARDAYVSAVKVRINGEYQVEVPQRDAVEDLRVGIGARGVPGQGAELLGVSWLAEHYLIPLVRGEMGRETYEAVAVAGV